MRDRLKRWNSRSEDEGYGSKRRRRSDVEVDINSNFNFKRSHDEDDEDSGVDEEWNSAVRAAGRTFWICYAVFASGLLYVSEVTNNVVQAYMDETLHIPQAQAFCEGRWSHWDPLITTPPGLYLLSALPARLLGLEQSLCSVRNLRRVNTLLFLLLPHLYARVLSLVRRPAVRRPSTKGKRSVSQAMQDVADDAEARFEGIVVALFPVLASFGWLYYTDMGSVVFVVISYDLSLRRSWFLSALVGVISLFFRQTNIAWVAFIAGNSLVQRLDSVSDLYNPTLSRATLTDPIFSLSSLASQSLRNPITILPVVAAYLPVFIGAAAFVKWNGTIVLGDKSHHTPTVHVPQLYYFAAFSALFLLPLLLSSRTLARSVMNLVGTTRSLLVSLVVLAAMLYSIKTCTNVHPFLLADNRHYAFYIWRRLINPHPLMRYALAPGYLVAARFLLDSLASSSSLQTLSSLFYLIALSLALIPTPLIEPRYFITPYILLRLHLRPITASPSPSSPSSRIERRCRLALEGLFYAAVLVLTEYVFVRKGFRWEGRDDVMRFMW